jgi:hypothetical protein
VAVLQSLAAVERAVIALALDFLSAHPLQSQSAQVALWSAEAATIQHLD